MDAAEGMALNRRHWDELADLHPATDFYNFYLDRMRAGGTSLHALEIAEVGDVDGLDLMHLQCHIGTESISWARRGARVTGVDFSANALTQARRLAAELGAHVDFVESNVYDLPDNLEARFDVVFQSWGVLGWLPDLPAWGRVVAHFLRPGGLYYIAEGHPFAWTLDDEADVAAPRYPYFGGPAMSEEADGSYADREAHIQNRETVTWPFELGGVVNALVDAGLRIEFLHEHPRVPFQMLQVLIRDETTDERWWRVPKGMPDLPLSFSLRARRE